MRNPALPPEPDLRLGIVVQDFNPTYLWRTTVSNGHFRAGEAHVIYGDAPSMYTVNEKDRVLYLDGVAARNGNLAVYHHGAVAKDNRDYLQFSDPENRERAFKPYPDYILELPLPEALDYGRIEIDTHSISIETIPNPEAKQRFLQPDTRPAITVNSETMVLLMPVSCPLPISTPQLNLFDYPFADHSPPSKKETA